LLPPRELPFYAFTCFGLFFYGPRPLLIDSLLSSCVATDRPTASRSRSSSVVPTNRLLPNPASSHESLPPSSRLRDNIWRQPGTQPPPITMASTAHTTGADAQAEELRRRNVAAPSQAAAPIAALAQEREKSKDKVRHLVQAASELSIFWWLQGLVANQTAAFQHHLLPGRLRIHLGTSYIHLLRLLHTHVQDWPLANCHLGRSPVSPSTPTHT
jgi:hypothetical protein